MYLLQTYESRLVVPEPNFSVESFFVFLTCMMVVSLVAFIFLNCWPSFRDEYAYASVQNDENVSNNSSDDSNENIGL